MAAASKNIEDVYWTRKEKKEFGESDQKCFDPQAFYVGYNVANVSYNAITTVNGSGGLLQEKFLQLHSLQCWRMPFCKSSI